MNNATRNSAHADILEMRRHHRVLLGRLAIETNRYERTSLEDQIVAFEALVAGLSVRLTDNGASFVADMRKAEATHATR